MPICRKPYTQNAFDLHAEVCRLLKINFNKDFNKTKIQIVFIQHHCYLLF